MHAAINNAINIIGAVVLRFCGQSTSGDSLETRQLTYITDSSDKLFLSREACVALGMISLKFPRIGEALTVQESDSVDSGPNPDVPHDVAPCGCRKRSPPPPPSSELPYPATVDNREKLQDFLMNTTDPPHSTSVLINHFPWWTLHGWEWWLTLTPSLWPTTKPSLYPSTGVTPWKLG